MPISRRQRCWGIHPARSRLASYQQMTTRIQTRNVLSGTTSMLLGSAAIFAAVLFMNHFSEQPPSQKQVQTVSFDVKKLEQPKPQKKVKKQRPKPQKRNAPPPMPLQGLNSSIAGIDFGMPDFSLEGLGEVNDTLLGDMQNVIMTDDTVDVPPRPNTRHPMPYPRQARAKGITGYVVLSLLINTEGQIRDIKLLESSPTGIFDQVAIDGVKTWKFNPAVYQGKKVQVWAKQKIRFDLG